MEGSGTFRLRVSPHHFKTYTGEVKNNAKHGQGLLTEADGTSYQGQFENDLKHGEGVSTDKNGI